MNVVFSGLPPSSLREACRITSYNVCYTKLLRLKRQHSSKPHNPLIASVFFKGGLIEAWGRGTINIINECLKANLSEPRFASEFGGISVTLYKNKYTEENLLKSELNERQIKAVLFVKERGKITNKEYQTMFGVARRTATRDLAELAEKGIFRITSYNVCYTKLLRCQNIMKNLVVM